MYFLKEGDGNNDVDDAVHNILLYFKKIYIWNGLTVARQFVGKQKRAFSFIANIVIGSCFLTRLLFIVSWELARLRRRRLRRCQFR